MGKAAGRDTASLKVIAQSQDLTQGRSFGQGLNGKDTSGTRLGSLAVLVQLGPWPQKPDHGRPIILCVAIFLLH